jgi:hypothetical protein
MNKKENILRDSVTSIAEISENMGSQVQNKITGQTEKLLNLWIYSKTYKKTSPLSSSILHIKTKDLSGHFMGPRSKDIGPSSGLQPVRNALIN